MRSIYLAQLDKARPVVILTRETAQSRMTKVTVAPITSRVRGLSSEVPVGTRNGLDHESIVNLDNVATIPRSLILGRIGALLEDQEWALTRALHYAYDLEGPIPFE